MTRTDRLFQPLPHAALTLNNRIAMAPMTRSRALGNVPNDVMRDYYAQRADAGLIITEGTSPSPDGLGYARIPGLFNDTQAAGWQKIADAVHARGAKLVVQLMHTGRVGHSLNLPEGAQLIAPSAVAVAGQMWTDSAGMQSHPVPKAMDGDDIARVRGDYVHAAQLAIGAGLDGVEIHAANGYLPGQFLNPKSNVRSDGYGGSAENRRRFLLELIDDSIAAIGRDRVGVRVSPFNPFNDLAANYEGEEEEFLALVAELSKRRIGYLHLIATPGAVPAAFVRRVRAAFEGVLILAGDYDRDRAETDLAAGLADVIAFGRPFLGNPDLARRLREDAPLSAFDPATLYTPGAAGYSDYPALAEAVAAS
ncbi:MAG TPA: alkene reductase [Arenimonas sp.]|uniref:alkene reductase n=1 Tax=Arenimonas sp. TaxID=1872635 RepID=UPI002CE39BD2|nr:alkene reductase [Arenimonas sp.]HMB57715.1 alkene reductase [Arenimonas sp.]